MVVRNVTVENLKLVMNVETVAMGEGEGVRMMMKE